MIFVSAIREGVRIRPSGRKLRPRPTSFCGQRARQSGEDDRLKRPLPSTLSPTRVRRACSGMKQVLRDRSRTSPRSASSTPTRGELRDRLPLRQSYYCQAVSYQAASTPSAHCCTLFPHGFRSAATRGPSSTSTERRARQQQGQHHGLPSHGRRCQWQERCARGALGNVRG